MADVSNSSLAGAGSGPFDALLTLSSLLMGGGVEPWAAGVVSFYLT